MYTHKRAIAIACCVCWGALAYSAAASISQPEYTIKQQLGIPVPVLENKPTQAVKRPPINIEKKQLPQNVRPTPYMSLTEKYMLAIALGEEARIDNAIGQHAMISAVLNRIGTTKDRNRVGDVLKEGNQFSFMWGDTKTKAGRVLLSGDAKAIAKLAKQDYAQELATVLSIVNKPHYADVTNGRTYYYNKKASSAKGKQWFAENVTDCDKIGLYHHFCYGKH